jgi:hypothetical protein
MLNDARLPPHPVQAGSPAGGGFPGFGVAQSRMDAYLSAFTICGGLLFVTLDRDFRGFRPRGLNVPPVKT